MKRCGSVKLCVALLSFTLVTACQQKPPPLVVHLPPKKSEPPASKPSPSLSGAFLLNTEKLGRDQHTFGSRFMGALRKYWEDHGRNPSSILDLSRSFLPAGLLIPACDEGTVKEHTLVRYHRTSNDKCSLQVDHYTTGAVSHDTMNFEKGAWMGGNAEYLDFVEQ